MVFLSNSNGALAIEPTQLNTSTFNSPFSQQDDDDDSDADEPSNNYKEKLKRSKKKVRKNFFLGIQTNVRRVSNIANSSRSPGTPLDLTPTLVNQIGIRTIIFAITSFLYRFAFTESSFNHEGPQEEQQVEEESSASQSANHENFEDRQVVVSPIPSLGFSPENRPETDVVETFDVSLPNLSSKM